MTERVFLGPFLTRAQAARRAGLRPDQIEVHPDLMRLRGPWLQEAYFAFQFDHDGLDRDVARLVRALKPGRHDGAIADWLVRPNPDLGWRRPLDQAHGDTSLERLVAAGPPVEASEPAPPPPAPSPSPIRNSPAHGRLSLRTPGWTAR